jgi:signal transduction histidine kinase
MPAALRWKSQPGDREALHVPLRFGRATLGVLTLVCSQAGRPSKARVESARNLGQQAAVAIAMHRLLDSACEKASRSVVEAERARMAGEIHDGVAQAFLSVMVHTRATRLGGLPRRQKFEKFLEDVESVAASGLEDARRLVFALRSLPIEREGLMPALESLLRRMSVAGSTQFALVNRAGALDVPPAIEDCVYRIVQEAAQNALKHAGAKRAVVHIERDGGFLKVRIEDDGPGDSGDVIQHARERGGFRAMRERADRCGGIVDVEPRTPRGTRVVAKLPLKA